MQNHGSEIYNIAKHSSVRSYGLIHDSFRSLVSVVVAIGFAVLSSFAQTIEFPGVSKARVAYIVRDFETGKDVCSKNVDEGLSPASIMKCVTAAALLSDSAISPQWRYTTDVIATGDILADTLLMGDIVIRSAGDPTFATPQMCEVNVIDTIAREIIGMGIRAIAGGVEIDSIPLSDSGAIPYWEEEDLKWAYGAGLYPFNYNDNRHSGDRAMNAPEDFFAADLETRLCCDSITMYWDGFDFEPQGHRLLYSHQSPPLIDILHEMMVSSNNLYAEAMLRRLLPGEPRRSAVERERNVLSNMVDFPPRIMIYDGSGLTRNNTVTAAFMTDILTAMAKSEVADEYVALFPKVGEEGTVKKLLANSSLKGTLALKSGSMRGVQCFAGYKLNSSGKPTHTVVIIINNFPGKRPAVVKGIENFLESIF